MKNEEILKQNLISSGIQNLDLLFKEGFYKAELQAMQEAREDALSKVYNELINEQSTRFSVVSISKIEEIFMNNGLAIPKPF